MRGTGGLCGTSHEGRLLGVRAAGCGWEAAPGAARQTGSLRGGGGRARGKRSVLNKKQQQKKTKATPLLSLDESHPPSSMCFAARPEGGA